MRVVLLSLAFVFCGMSLEAGAQCAAPAGVYYGGYAGYAPYGASYAPYSAYYGPYATYAYAPYRARQPNYPLLYSATPPARYSPQTSYFRGGPGGPFAPPGGTFFGGYDYQVTYPVNWFGGYWGNGLAAEWW